MSQYDKLYLLALGIVLYGLYYLWRKNKNTRYEENLEIKCSKCGKKQETVYEIDDNKFKYKCPECKNEEIVDLSKES